MKPEARMGAMILPRFGGPDVLEWTELPRPVPANDEVLVRVAACGLNRLDVWNREGGQGDRLRLPHVLGNEPVGTVEENGPSATRFRPGDRVVVAPGFIDGPRIAGRSGFDAGHPDYKVVGSQCPGGYAEFVKAREENLVAIGDRWTLEEWAATPLVFLTAWHMLVGRARVRRGETVLVIAAGSGVGSSAIQIARHLGCRVIATAGSMDKLDRAIRLGAQEGVNHYEDDWPKQVRALTGRDGVDVVVEHVGEAVFGKALTTLGYGGRLVTCGTTTGTDGGIHLGHLFVKQISVLGSYMGDAPELVEVLGLLDEGKLRPVVDRVFPIREAAAAHRRLEASEHFGKIVLKHG